MDARLSKTFNLLRFPLIVLVVFIHTFDGAVTINGMQIEGGGICYHALGNLISRGLARIAVPLFFFMSGYLYFKESSLSVTLYRKKTKTRVKSLLIPYLLWNVWVLVFMFGYQWIGAKVGFEFSGKLIRDFTAADFVRSFWDRGSGYPICFQLWFLRDLILLSFLAPVIYYSIRSTRGLILFIPGAMYLCGWMPSVFPSISAVLYFSLGAAYKLCGWNWIDGFVGFGSRMSRFYPIILVSTFLFEETGFGLFLMHAAILIGVVWALNLSYRAASCNCSGHFTEALIGLSAASFFVYASHEPLQGLLKKILYLLLQPSSDAMHVFIYFLGPVLTIAVALSVFYLLEKLLPGFLRIVNGR